MSRLWWHWWRNAYNARPRRRRIATVGNSGCRFARPLLERLEDRTLLSAPALSGTAPSLVPHESAAQALLSKELAAHPTYVLFKAQNETLAQTAGPVGFTPDQLRTAYGINNIAFGATTGDGTGQTIAIVDAYNDPDALSELDGFDKAVQLTSSAPTLYQQYGKAASFFSVYNQSGKNITSSIATSGKNGVPPVDPTPAGPGANDWEVEEALDIEWVHAIAPGAKIDLVEANSPDNALYAAVSTAAALPGVSVVSMSWGASESIHDIGLDSTFTTPSGHQGVTFLAASGDSGSPGLFPAYSSNVVAVGGTTLTVDAQNNYQGEDGWGGSGGGTSQYETEPIYQNGVQSTGQRTIPDVAFDADPASGVAVYDSYNNGTSTPWEQLGGTSFAVQAWAGLIGITNQGRGNNGTLDSSTNPDQTLSYLYALTSSNFHDITQGSNGQFSAGPGYDEVTGLGTPVANLLVPALAHYTPTASKLTIAAPPPSYVTNGTTFSVAVSATDSAGNLVSSFDGNVTVSLAGTPGGATLGGTLTVAAVGGVATFSDLTINNPGSGYQLLFQATINGQLQSTKSASFNVVNDLEVITKTDTNQPGSLRAAVGQADADAALGKNDTITFAPTLDGATITLTSGQLELSAGSGTTTIEGGGQIDVSSNNANPIFQVDSGAEVVLTGLTLGNTGGDAIANAGALTVRNTTLSGSSYGILNTGTLKLVNSTLSGNLGAGALDNAGALMVSNTTFENNSYSINNASAGTAIVSNSTFSGNSGPIDNAGTLTATNCTISGNAGDGIDTTGTLTLQNTIVAGNTGADIAGSITNDAGYNLLGTDVNNNTNDPAPGPNDVFNDNPALASLGNLGGPTQTMALLPGSPAIGAGVAIAGITTDQRGAPRPASNPDIGAFQTQTPRQLTVTTTSDDAVHSGTSLRDAITQANADSVNYIADTITFASSLDGDTIILSQGELELTAGIGTITIDVEGHLTISGNLASTVFLIDSGAQAVFTGLTIQHGSAVYGVGGGIDNEGTLTLVDSTLSSNSAFIGGAIFNNGTLTLVNSTLSGNSAAVGGAIDNYGILSLANSTLSDNAATFSLFGGGGIDNNGTLTLTNSTLSGNSAAFSGGAIYNNYFGTLTLANSTLSGNYAAYSGGGISNTGTLTLSDSTISGNTASDGGGVYSYSFFSTPVHLVNTIVADNSVGGFAPDMAADVAAGSVNNLIGDGTGLFFSSSGDAIQNQVGTSINPIDPLLGPLGNYGGNTQTMPLLVGSPAFAAGGAVTSLTAAITDTTSTTITVQDASAIARTAGNYLILIDGEVMLVSNVDLAANTLTVVRGVNDTTAATHSDGAGVYLATDQRGLPRSGTPDVGAFQSQGATLTLNSAALPATTAGQFYKTIISAAGGSGNYDFTLASGTLPAGLSLSAAGVVTGTASCTPGTYQFIVLVTDKLNRSLIGSPSCSLTVYPPFPMTQSLNSSGNTMIAGTYVTGTTAYYEFTVDTSGGLTASVTPADSSAFLPQLTLYGAEGQLLIQADSAPSGNTSAQLQQQLQPGTYYLGVTAVRAGASGNPHYVLNATFGQALPPFQAAPAGNHPQGVAVGYFSNDGNLDIVTANSFNDTVSVLLGNGNGTFQPAVNYSVLDAAFKGIDPVAVTVAQLVPGGNFDIITANAGDNTVSVLLGNGDGTFQSAVTYSVFDSNTFTGFEPVAVAVAQLVAGSNFDIVTANAGDDTVSVLLGKGDGTFQSAVTYSVMDAQGQGIGPSAVAVAQLVPGGNADIVTANSADDTVSVLLGNGDGSFQTAVTYSVTDATGNGFVPVALALAQLVPGGNFDIITANSDSFDNGGEVSYGAGTVSVLLGKSDGTFGPATTYQVGFDGPVSVAVGEFSHDGNLDIVTANQFGSTVAVLVGRGDGTFAPAAYYQVGSNPSAVVVGDFANNGNLDIVTANAADNTLSVLMGRGDGTFVAPTSYHVGDFPNSMAVGTFTPGGNLDIVTTNGMTVSVLLGLGDGTFLPDPFSSPGLPPGTFAVGHYPLAVALGNFTNHDGNDDIVTANQDGSVSVLLGLGDGTFAPAVTYSVGLDPVFVTVGDFNGDRNLDIITANAGDNTVSVLLGNGKGGFIPDPYSSPGLPPGTFAVGISPVSVAVGAITGNGRVGIVTANAGDNTASVLLGDGNGNFQPAVSYNVGNTPYSVAVGDFTDDFKLDIVTANLKDNTVSVLLDNGDGTFAPAATYAVGVTPVAVVVGDFNKDGHFDIVTSNNGTNTVSVLLGQGNGRFQTSSPNTSIAALNTPVMQAFNGVPDTFILNSSGDLLFRRGLDASPVIVNPDNPSRDFTIFQTPTGPALAAIDDAGDTVSIYTYAGADPAHPFELSTTLPTGHLPVRIAAADLTGNGLDDLVVANDFNNNVFIYLQTAAGQFASPITRQVGIGPSDITFVNVAGQRGPDIVVSDQISGDFTVLVNDASASSQPTFDVENRYRAGGGLFDISIDPTTGVQSVLSQLQTAGIAVGDFTTSGREDIVALNANAHTFSLVPNLGLGRFGTSQPGSTYFTSAQPTQIVSVTLPGDKLASVAVLMQDLGQIWLYRNNGDGTFATPSAANGTEIFAGNDPSGLSVATINGQPALLVGNNFGDILTLVYVKDMNNHDTFAPDRANLQNAPLSVGTTSKGQQFAVVADQNRDEVSLYYFSPGTNELSSSITISGTNQVPLLAPGAVQPFDVTIGTVTTTYLAIANSLSNDILVFQDQSNEQFVFLRRYQVGDDPKAITVADVNNDGIPDLLVANRGSNDISVLIGSTATGSWDATPYQRLNSRGSGPIAVNVQFASGSEINNLVVTNSDGTITVIRGIGSAGRGSGFFEDNTAELLTVPNGTGLGQPSFLGTTGIGFAPTGDGSIVAINLNTFTANVVFQGEAGLGVNTLEPIGPFIVVGFSNGTIGLLTDNGQELAVAEQFTSGELNDISALAVEDIGGTASILATNAGSDQLFVLGFVTLLPTIFGGAPIIVSNGLNETSVIIPNLPFTTVSNLEAVVQFTSGNNDIISQTGELLQQEGAFSGLFNLTTPLQFVLDPVNGQLDAYLTYSGTELPTSISFSILNNELNLLNSTPGAVATNPSNLDLILVATLRPGDLVERLPVFTTAAIPNGEIFAAFLPPANQLINNVGAGEEQEALVAERIVVIERKPIATGWESYPIGAREALQKRLLYRQIKNEVDDWLHAMEEFLERLQGLLMSPVVLSEPVEVQAQDAQPLSVAFIETEPPRSLLEPTEEREAPIPLAAAACDELFACTELLPTTIAPQWPPECGNRGEGEELHGRSVLLSLWLAGCVEPYS